LHFSPCFLSFPLRGGSEAESEAAAVGASRGTGGAAPALELFPPLSKGDEGRAGRDQK